MVDERWFLKGPGCGPDLVVVRQALRLLVDPRAGFQLTCSPAWAWGTFPGDEGGIGRALRWVEDHGDALSVYFALNSVSADLPGRVRCEDVLRRRWLLVDVDRVKAHDDKSLSATEQEHADALALAEQVRDHLHGLGWPEPGLHVDSGNGAHLLYRVDLPNDEESRKAMGAFLKGLSEQFGRPGQIDRAVHDARRISKLPGTWARKGPNTRERPHRVARIIEAQDEPAVVSLDLIRSSTPEPPARKTAAPPVTPGAAVEKSGRDVWLLRPVQTEDPALAYARRVLESQCENMRQARPGNLNNQLAACSRAVGNYVGSGLLNREECVEALLAAAEAAGCDNPKKDRGTVERNIDAGAKDPRRPPQRADGSPAAGVIPGPAAKEGGGHPVAADAIARAMASTSVPFKPTGATFREIMRTEYPDPRWAVEGILSEGLNLLAGKPKLGKSWFALSLGLTVAGGGVALGGIAVSQGPVLYLALEDRFRRIKKRGQMLLDGLRIDPPDDLMVYTEWPKLDHGGLDLICRWIEEQGFTGEAGNRVANGRLIVIDVWAKFRPAATSSRASAYDVDYGHMAALKNVLDHYGCSALVLHHTRKAIATDAMDEVSGTTGLGGAADGVLILSRARVQDGDEMEAELLIMSRDAEEKKLALTVDKKNWSWTSHGSAAERQLGKLSGAILDVLRSNAGLVLSIQSIMDALRLGEPVSKNTLRQTLVRLADNDKIERVKDGHYRVPLRRGDESAF